MDVAERIRAFLDGGPFAVVGASRDRSKFGNRILRCYLGDGRIAFPVNPRESEIEGQPCFTRLADLPEVPHGVSIITPPPITERVVEEVAAAEIPFVWIQPGAESAAAVARAEDLGLQVISGGPCLLVQLGCT